MITEKAINAKNEAIKRFANLLISGKIHSIGIGLDDNGNENIIINSDLDLSSPESINDIPVKIEHKNKINAQET